MSDFNHNNNDLNNDRPQESQTSRRTYDLDNHSQEPQASFGSGDWQWQPAQPQPEPKKRPRWGRIVLSVVAVAVAAALCFTAGYAGVLVANQKNTVVIQQVTPNAGGSGGTDGQLPASADCVLTSAQVAAKVD